MVAALVRATVKLPFSDLLPRDISENVFHFRDAVAAPPDPPNAEALEIMRNNIQFHLEQFYNGNHPFEDEPSASNTIASYLSDCIDREACSIQYALVDPVSGDTQPAWDETTWELGPISTGSGSDLPTEVALCLTNAAYAPTPASDVTIPQRRRRGRTYLGPWNGKAVGTEDPDGVARPLSGLLRIIAHAGRYLVNQSVHHEADAELEYDNPPGEIGVPSMDWVVWSRVGGVTNVINGGYVDNEWDTQRRRGVEATTRLQWNFGATG